MRLGSDEFDRRLFSDPPLAIFQGRRFLPPSLPRPPCTVHPILCLSDRLSTVARSDFLNIYFCDHNAFVRFSSPSILYYVILIKEKTPCLRPIFRPSPPPRLVDRCVYCFSLDFTTVGHEIARYNFSFRVGYSRLKGRAYHFSRFGYPPRPQPHPHPRLLPPPAFPSPPIFTSR